MNDLKRRTLAIMKHRLPYMIRNYRWMPVENVIVVTIVAQVDDELAYMTCYAKHDGMDEYDQDKGFDIAYKRCIRKLAEYILESNPSCGFVTDCAASAAMALMYE